MRTFMQIASPLFAAGLLSACTASGPPALSVVADGWSRSSINTVKFRHSPLATYKTTQFIAFYDGEQHVVVGKRPLGTDRWETKTTALTGNTADAHNTISIAVDGAGFLHLAWDHHNEALHYVISNAPLSLDLVPAKTDGVAENSVTYPEFYNLPNGDLMLLYRDGSSGNGNLVLKHYSLAEKKWSTVHEVLIASHDTRVDDQGKVITYNAYWEMCIDAQARFILDGLRGTPDVASNHDICYAQSADNGKTWTTAAGMGQPLPITAANCETAVSVATHHDLINQTSISTDVRGLPYICTFYKPADDPITQLMIVHFNGTAWKTYQVGERKTALNLGGGGTKRLLLSRPLILVDDSPTPNIHIIFRDVDRGDRITLATSHDLAKNQWTFKDLTAESYGLWEPTCDESLWAQQKIISLFVQKTDQLDGNDNTPRAGGPPPSPVSVLEYRP